MTLQNVMLLCNKEAEARSVSFWGVTITSNGKGRLQLVYIGIINWKEMWGYNESNSLPPSSSSLLKDKKSKDVYIGVGVSMATHCIASNAKGLIHFL